MHTQIYTPSAIRFKSAISLSYLVDLVEEMSIWKVASEDGFTSREKIYLWSKFRMIETCPSSAIYAKQLAQL